MLLTCNSGVLGSTQHFSHTGVLLNNTCTVAPNKDWSGGWLPWLPVCHQLQNLHHELPQAFPAHLLLQLNLITGNTTRCFISNCMNIC